MHCLKFFFFIFISHSHFIVTHPPVIIIMIILFMRPIIPANDANPGWTAPSFIHRYRDMFIKLLKKHHGFDRFSSLKDCVTK